MAHGFNHNGERHIDITLTQSAIERSRREWKKVVSSTPDYPENFEGKGIVISGGGARYYTCTWVLVSVLKNLGCELPIEIWFSGDELNTEMIVTIESLGVKCKNIQDYVLGPAAGFMMKPLSIIHSSFQEVLFLDADNVPVSDPTYLFYDLNYLREGTAFWPDYWRTPEANPIWKILGLQFNDEQEQESGQILINKKKCWKELNLARYMNEPQTVFDSLIYGDKDTFRFAWKALSRSYYMIPYDVGSCGYYANGKFHGTTMVQFDSSGEIIFLHRNLLKWDVTNIGEKVWKHIKRFPLGKNISKLYEIWHTDNFHSSMDLHGDWEDIDFEAKFPDFENRCLDALSLLRNSDTYSNILQYDIHLKKLSKLQP